ncbi:hypothetical protein OQA88_12397 [Cercophora sp. LCS_1]
MGWFWTSSSPTTPPSSQPRAAPSSPPPPKTTTTSSDAEVQKFLDLLQQETTKSPPQQAQSPPPPPPPPAATPTPTTTWSSYIPYASIFAAPVETPAPPPPPETRSASSLALSESQLPTTMSCRDAFDYAWHCHTPGAQWNAVYRYGSVRSCSELWDDFWFCMRTKSYSPEMKAEAIKAHYREKEKNKYGGGKPSSEDVWESRDSLVKPGTAFTKPIEAPVVDDDEFQRLDAERRRSIREELGVERK